MSTKARWWCHCCGAQNAPIDEDCRVCKRHNTYVSPMSMSSRPLHGGSADCIRFKQFEVLLDKDMKRDAARRHLLRNGGMEESRLDAIGGDDEENGTIRRCVDQLMNAADVAGRSVHNLRVGTGGSVELDGVMLDSKNVIRSLTGVTGEKAAAHIKRRFYENSDICAGSMTELSHDHGENADNYSIASNAMSQVTGFEEKRVGSNKKEEGGEGHSVAAVAEDKRKWPMPKFVQTSVTPKQTPTPLSIVQKIQVDKSHRSGGRFGMNDREVDASLYKKNALERVHRLAKGIEKLEDPRDALFKKAFIDMDDESWTPLHVAASNGSSELVASLLHGGSMIEAKTHHGWRAIHLAAASAHVKVVSILLKHPKNDATWVTDGEKQSALHLAARSDGPGGGISLIAANAVVDEVITRLIKAGASMEARNFMGRTPLMEAAFVGKPRAVARLLFLGANVHAEDNEGWSARQVAEFVGYQEVTDVIVNYLKMKNGPDKVLPAPDYQSKYYNETKRDFRKAKKESMKAEYRRQTYKMADKPLQEWALDIKFKKYMHEFGPGQSVFEYDIREQREEYNKTFFGLKKFNEKQEDGSYHQGNVDNENDMDQLSYHSSVSGLTNKSVASGFYETRPVAPFPSGGGVMTVRLNTADRGQSDRDLELEKFDVTRPATSSSSISLRQTMSRSGSRTAFSGRRRKQEDNNKSQTMTSANHERQGMFYSSSSHHKKEWMVKTPYDPYSGEDSAEELKRTRDLREMARMERRREFDTTMKPPAAALSPLLR